MASEETIKGEDGTSRVVSYRFAGHFNGDDKTISGIYWNRRHSEPFTYGYYRQNGYQAVSYETDGVETRVPEYGYVTMYRYEWVNPNPEKIIHKIEYVAKERAKTDVYVSRISVVE